MVSNEQTIGGLKKKEPLTIFISGQSGCGKKTITEKYLQHIEKTEPNRIVVVSETGEHFRNMTKTAPPWLIEDIKATQIAGKFQPHHHAVRLTVNALYDLIQTNDEHIIIDGSPRSEKEAIAIFSYLEDVYGRRPIVIYPETSDNTCRKRMLGRNDELIAAGDQPRMDAATLGSINKKLAEFHAQTLPAIQSLPAEYLITVNGELPPDDVFAEVLQKLALHETRLKELLVK
ncbi:MAG: nucleoside monophosphate kinase [Candidatus Pacebacteria bacterium]|nr:nucleoside monophosphate kinase [Candidatus Paceibacterota bacterium]